MPDTEETMPLPQTIPAGQTVVYDLEGKPHTMSHLNASDCVTHLGWMRKILKVAEGAAQKVVVVVAKAAKDIDPENAEEVDIMKLDIEALIAFAKKHFDMEFSVATHTKDAIIAAIVDYRGE